MINEVEAMNQREPDERGDAIELPAPSVWPLVLSLAITLLLIGLATSLLFSLVGGLLFVVALVGWVRQLLPGHPHLAEPSRRDRGPAPVAAAAGRVGHLEQGMPGYRLRLPQQVHPISAGVKGGLAGGLVMPLPALAYGVMSGRGFWYPVNLLAGTVLPSLADLGADELGHFHLSLFVMAIVIHAVMSVVLGLMYGVLLPMLPPLPGGQLVWGGLLMPLLWTGVCYGLMGVANPVLQRGVEWGWFVVSQFVYGITAAMVVMRTEKISIPPAGTGRDRVEDSSARS